MLTPSAIMANAISGPEYDEGRCMAPASRSIQGISEQERC
jgi:hypothetical protein